MQPTTLNRALRIELAVIAAEHGAMCRVPGRPPANRLTGAMSMGTFRELIDDQPGLQEVTLQGTGEPLLVPNVVEMVRYATRRDVRVTIESNATLLYRDRAEELVDAGLHRLRVLMDGVNQYEDALTATAFGPILENLAGFTAVWRASGAGKPRVDVVFLASAQNIAQLPDIVALLGGIWIDEIRVQFLSLVDPDPGLFSPLSRPTQKELDPVLAAKVFVEARRTAEEYGVRLDLPERYEATEECDATPYVTSDGVMRTCKNEGVIDAAPVC